jgi:AcrR family transcriptional regulator
MAKPLTREESRAQTRARLLDGARAVFARRGYHAATVDEVAAQAGFTTGALYSNFKGKEDLFLAVVEDMIAREVREYTEIFEGGATFDQRARGGADRWMELLGEDPDYFRLFVELWSAAIRDPGLRAKFAERSGALRDATTRMIEAEAAELEVDASSDDARTLATVVNALGNGLAMERLMFPGSVPDNLFGDILAVLFRALAEAAPEAPAGKEESK